MLLGIHVAIFNFCPVGGQLDTCIYVDHTATRRPVFASHYLHMLTLYSFSLARIPDYDSFIHA